MNNMGGIDYNSEYNKEPVFFCTNCLSLKIKAGDLVDFCCDCGSTEIQCASLETYDTLHEARFGKKKFYVNN